MQKTSKPVYSRTIDPKGDDSLARIARFIGGGARVLDIGAGYGELGRYLSASKNCVVDGVDCDAKRVKTAAPHYRKMVSGDIEKTALSHLFPDEKYDYIVCADVLEHLRDPGRILDQISQMLTADGRIILSIPNVAHVGVLAELLAGEFRYRSEGLLDETHLRFFTLNSLLELIGSHGLVPVKLERVEITPYESEFRGRDTQSFPPRLVSYLRELPEALTYQFVLEVAPKDSPVAAREKLDDVGNAEKPPLEFHFASQLYWSNDETAVDESHSKVMLGLLGGENQVLRFDIPPQKKAPVLLRLDPADRPGFLNLHRMSLYDKKGACIWEWNGEPGVLEKSKGQRQVSFPQEKSAGDTFTVLLRGDDPSLAVPIPKEKLKGLKNGGAFELSMSWPKSDDYRVLAKKFPDDAVSRERDRLSVERDELQRVKDVLISERDEIEAKRHALTLELEAMKEYKRISEALMVERDEIEAKRHSLTLELNKHIIELEHMRGSLSWRLTYPLRRGREIAMALIRPFRRKKYNMKAVMGNDIRASNKEDGFWEVTGNDPYVHLIGDSGMPTKGLVRLIINIDFKTTPWTPPCLYIDTGDGFNEWQRLKLPRPREGAIKSILYFGENARALRFDPLDGSNIFRINKVSIQEIGRLEAGLQMIPTLIFDRLRNPRVFKEAIAEAFRLWRKSGLEGLKGAIMERSNHLHEDEAVHSLWVKAFDTLHDSDREGIHRHIERFLSRPIISVIMPVYNTPEQYLRQAIESVQNQLYPDWELCIADDASTMAHVKEILNEYREKDSRIKVTFRKENGHISEASNSAIEMASGEYITFLDHDDELSEHALYYVANEINQFADANIIYSDEDKIDADGNRYEPHFKPDWNLDMLYSNNYLNHLTVYRSALVKEVGGLRKDFHGSQDHDLCLRCSTKVEPDKIRHIPRILYHWRAIPGSTALSSSEKRYPEAASIKSLKEHFQSEDTNIKVEHGEDPFTYRIYYPLPDSPPLVSIIIPTRDRSDLLKLCVESIRERTEYKNYEIIIIDNQSSDISTLTYMKTLEKNGQAKISRYDHPFNFSGINNYGVSKANGEIICLMNNDIEVITPEWLGEMVSNALRKDIGAVGAKLLFDNNQIQHGGVVLGLGGIANHSHKFYPSSASGYFSRMRVAQNISAVTGACLVIRREVYEEVNGLDEALPVAFNDIDFCLKVHKAGYRNLWTPYAVLYHHESLSRGDDNTGEKYERFKREIDLMKERWGDILLNDPYYNPNLTLEMEGFSVAPVPRVKKPWVADKVPTG